MDRERADDCFHGTRSAHEMAGHRLGGTHRETTAVRPEETLDRASLHNVVRARGGAVSVDVVAFLRLDVRLVQRLLHRAVVADAFGMRRERMICFATPAVSDDLGVDLSAAAECVSELLQDDVSAAFAEDKS